MWLKSNHWDNLKQHSKIIKNTKNGKGKRKLPKNEDISIGKVYTNTQKLIRNILTITDVFLDQKRIIVCEQTVNMA